MPGFGLPARTVQSLPEKCRVLRPPGTQPFRGLFFCAQETAPHKLSESFFAERPLEPALLGYPGPKAMDWFDPAGEIKALWQRVTPFPGQSSLQNPDSKVS